MEKITGSESKANNTTFNSTARSQEFFAKFKDILMSNLEWAENDHINDEVLATGDNVDRYNAEKEKVLSLRLKGRNDLYIKKVRQALLRVQEKTFGECQECGCDISERRLLARPTASLCINCKEVEERDENKTLDRNRASAKVAKTDNILQFKNPTSAKKFNDEIA